MAASFDRPRRRALRWLGGALAAPACLQAAMAAASPVRVGMTAELRMTSSTSDDAVRLGLELAIEDLNAAGGVLGRPLLLEVRDDRSVPSRGVENLRELAALPDLVGVFGSRFSPVLTEMGQVAPALQCPVFSPWAAGNTVLDPTRQPDWSFRVSLNDTWAMETLLDAAAADGCQRVGLMLPNSGWGRSCHKVVEDHSARHRRVRVLPARWYNWGGETSLIDHVLNLRQAGAQALVLVANEPEGVLLMREMLSLPPPSRLPILSHWGIAGGDFPRLVGPALGELDLRVVQTAALQMARTPRGRRLQQRAAERMGVADPQRVPSLVGLGHAYDAMLILHRAVARAGTTRREAVRDALEHLDPVEGVVRRYAPAFTRERHEALHASDVFLARWDAEGRLQRAPRHPT